MIIDHGEVHGILIEEKPQVHETIADDINIPECLKVFNRINLYKRDQDACPFGRGNWVVDFFQAGQKFIPGFCIKLPLDMTEDEVKRWLNPLSEALKNSMN